MLCVILNLTRFVSTIMLLVPQLKWPHIVKDVDQHLRQRDADGTRVSAVLAAPKFALALSVANVSAVPGP